VFSKARFTENVSAVGKIVAITGCNTGIGLETARELNLRGANVYMLCRNEQRAETAKHQMVQDGCDASRFIYVNCDLGNMESVRKCAAKMSELEDHIDILINNAGMTLNGYVKTAEGHEATWQTNHLGPFLLTQLLLPLVENAKKGRIVIVSSALHAKSPVIDLATIDSESVYGPYSAYNKSKLANLMFARELSRRLRARGNNTVTVNALHPGVISTELGREFGVGYKIFTTMFGVFLKSRKDGAQTTIYLALSTEVENVSGHYFQDCHQATESPKARDDQACARLYDYSMKEVGLA
ncbi:hypothetical protein PFISCL1PPCAC_27939, partial [Pristionchus fissidentatus]